MLILPAPFHCWVKCTYFLVLSFLRSQALHLLDLRFGFDFFWCVVGGLLLYELALTASFSLSMSLLDSTSNIKCNIQYKFTPKHNKERVVSLVVKTLYYFLSSLCSALPSAKPKETFKSLITDVYFYLFSTCLSRLIQWQTYLEC